MERIEAYEQRIELEEDNESDTKLLRLGFDLNHIKVKGVSSNTDHARNVALADEIKKLWGIPIPRVMRNIKLKGYEFVRETFYEVQKNPNARSPAGLFLHIVEKCKVELKDV